MSRPGLYVMVFLILMNTCSVPSKREVREIAEKAEKACKSQVE